MGYARNRLIWTVDRSVIVFIGAVTTDRYERQAVLVIRLIRVWNL